LQQLTTVLQYAEKEWLAQGTLHSAAESKRVIEQIRKLNAGEVVDEPRPPPRVPGGGYGGGMPAGGGGGGYGGGRAVSGARHQTLSLLTISASLQLNSKTIFEL